MSLQAEVPLELFKSSPTKAKSLGIGIALLHLLLSSVFAFFSFPRSLFAYWRWKWPLTTFSFIKGIFSIFFICIFYVGGVFFESSDTGCYFFASCTTSSSCVHSTLQPLSKPSNVCSYRPSLVSKFYSTSGACKHASIANFTLANPSMAIPCNVSTQTERQTKRLDPALFVISANATRFYCPISTRFPGVSPLLVWNWRRWFAMPFSFMGIQAVEALRVYRKRSRETNKPVDFFTSQKLQPDEFMSLKMKQAGNKTNGADNHPLSWVPVETSENAVPASVCPIIVKDEEGLEGVAVYTPCVSQAEPVSSTSPPLSFVLSQSIPSPPSSFLSSPNPASLSVSPSDTQQLSAFPSSNVILASHSASPASPPLSVASLQSAPSTASPSEDNSQVLFPSKQDEELVSLEEEFENDYMIADSSLFSSFLVEDNTASIATSESSIVSFPTQSKSIQPALSREKHYAEGIISSRTSSLNDGSASTGQHDAVDLFVLTVDGTLFRVDTEGRFHWKYKGGDLTYQYEHKWKDGPPFSFTSSHKVEKSKDPIKAIHLYRRLLAGHDGKLFFWDETQTIINIQPTIPDIVGRSPLQSPLFPGVVFTGKRNSQLIILDYETGLPLYDGLSNRMSNVPLLVQAQPRKRLQLGCTLWSITAKDQLFWHDLWGLSWTEVGTIAQRDSENYELLQLRKSLYIEDKRLYTRNDLNSESTNKLKFLQFPSNVSAVFLRSKDLIFPEIYTMDLIVKSSIPYLSGINIVSESDGPLGKTFRFVPLLTPPKPLSLLSLYDPLLMKYKAVFDNGTSANILSSCNSFAIHPSLLRLCRNLTSLLLIDAPPLMDSPSLSKSLQSTSQASCPLPPQEDVFFTLKTFSTPSYRCHSPSLHDASKQSTHTKPALYYCAPLPRREGLLAPVSSSSRFPPFRSQALPPYTRKQRNPLPLHEAFPYRFFSPFFASSRFPLERLDVCKIEDAKEGKVFSHARSTHPPPRYKRPFNPFTTPVVNFLKKMKQQVLKQPFFVYLRELMNARGLHVPSLPPFFVRFGEHVEVLLEHLWLPLTFFISTRVATSFFVFIMGCSFGFMCLKGVYTLLKRLHRRLYSLSLPPPMLEPPSLTERDAFSSITSTSSLYETEKGVVFPPLVGSHTDGGVLRNGKRPYYKTTTTTHVSSPIITDDEEVSPKQKNKKWKDPAYDAVEAVKQEYTSFLFAPDAFSEQAKDLLTAQPTWPYPAHVLFDAPLSRERFSSLPPVDSPLQLPSLVSDQGIFSTDNALHFTHRRSLHSSQSLPFFNKLSEHNLVDGIPPLTAASLHSSLLPSLHLPLRNTHPPFTFATPLAPSSPLTLSATNTTHPELSALPGTLSLPNSSLPCISHSPPVMIKEKQEEEEKTCIAQAEDGDKFLLSQKMKDFATAVSFEKASIRFSPSDSTELPTTAAAEISLLNKAKVIKHDDKPLPLLSSPVSNISPESALAVFLENGRFSRTFDMISVIGSGGFGTVYRVRHRFEFGSPIYAMKLVTLHLRPSENASSRWYFREVTANRGILSKHVVRYYTWWCEEPQFLPIDSTSEPFASPRLIGSSTLSQGESARERPPRIVPTQRPYKPSFSLPRRELTRMLKQKRKKYHAHSSSTWKTRSSALTIRQRTYTEMAESLITNSSIHLPSEGVRINDAVHGFSEDAYSEGEDRFKLQPGNKIPSFTALPQRKKGTKKKKKKTKRKLTDANLLERTFYEEFDPFRGGYISERERDCVTFAESSRVEPSNKSAITKNVSYIQGPPFSSLQRVKAEPKYPVVLLIQMEMCFGVTLRQWLDREERSTKPLDFQLINKNRPVEFDLFRQLIKGLKDIHEQGIVHRDLKPENIFVDPDSLDLKICDFGLARVVEAKAMEKEYISEKASATQTLAVSDLTSQISRKGQLIGTPSYAAPEGGALCDDKADIYSCALILLELLCPRFTTFMEKQKTLQNFRMHFSVPEFISCRLPRWYSLMKQMADTDPTKRISASRTYTVIKQLLSETPDRGNEEMNDVGGNRDFEISENL